MPNVGELVGGYRLNNPIATGQNSQVFEAIQEGSGRKFAVKFLLRERLKDTALVSQLQHEAIVAKQLEHPNVIRVFEYDRNKKSKDGPYYVMEYFPGLNLKIAVGRDIEQIRRQARKIITQIAQALAYTHDKGWVHRDFKPENVLVNNTGEVRVIDWGLAFRIRKGLSKLFASKPAIQGTRSYMAPEQIRREQLDGRADIYALGITIYEMLVGRPPIRASNPDELLLKHLRVQPPPLSSFEIEVSPEFDALALRMLAKKREERPENLHSFLAEFRKIRIMANEPPPQQDPMGGMGF